MANQELVQAIKDIIGLVKGGNLDGGYLGYRDLFASEAFRTYRPEDQRQALKLMIFMDGAPKVMTPAMVEAHRAAIAPLTVLVSTLGDLPITSFSVSVTSRSETRRAQARFSKPALRSSERAIRSRSSAAC